MSRKELVSSFNLNQEDTEEWCLKYYRHRNHAERRGLVTHLSISEYFQKVVDAGLTTPDQIGKFRGQFHLSRINDEGPYTVGSCRFILSEENHRERGQSEQYKEGIKRRSENWKKNGNKHPGQSAASIEEWRKNISRSRIGNSTAAKEFVLIDPNGRQHGGKNVKEFSTLFGLNMQGIYAVLSGRKQHHQGWVGFYIT